MTIEDGELYLRTEQFGDDIVYLSSVGLALELGNEPGHDLAFIARAFGPYLGYNLPRRVHNLVTAGLLGQVLLDDSQLCLFLGYQVLPVTLLEGVDTLLTLPCFFGDNSDDIRLFKLTLLGNFGVPDG